MGKEKGENIWRKKQYLFVEKEKQGRKRKKMLEKEEHIKFQVVHKFDALFDFTQLTMCLM